MSRDPKEIQAEIDALKSKIDALIKEKAEIDATEYRQRRESLESAFEAFMEVSKLEDFLSVDIFRHGQYEEEYYYEITISIFGQEIKTLDTRNL
jgi:hypothetical protein